MRVKQVSWSSPVTNRLLLDAGYGATYYGGGNPERPGNPTRDLIRVTEQCASGCAGERRYSGPRLPLAGLRRQLQRLVQLARVGGLRHRRAQPEGRLPGYLPDERSGVVDEQPESHLPVQQRRAEPAHRIHQPHGRQRTCRVARALRPGTVDIPPPHVAGGAAVRPGEQLVPGAACRTVEVHPGRDDLPRDDGVDTYKDITPRMGVAYDLFGNGKTALKLNVGKYLEGVGLQLNYINTSPISADAPLDEPVRDCGRDADLDRRERELPARLRSAEPARQRSTQQWR